MKHNIHASKVIDTLGGTAKVARLFDISMPSIAKWKKEGVPNARMMFLRAVYSTSLNGIDLVAATAPRKKGIHSLRKT